jgi:EAL domain-containing protein (putative c-di-GMP-specific phosphodiesterase class I)
MEVLHNTPFMYEVETWILRTACHQLHQWITHHDMTDTTLQMSVNLSPGALENPNLIHAIAQIIQDTHIQPHQLVLEITEHSFINTSGLILRTLTELCQMGLQFALDDFGTGYASLSCLHQLPIATIKIDRTFIQALGTDDSLQQITSGISALSQALDLKLVAEGIETAQQLAFLRRNQCAYGQGYLFSYPLPATAATALLSSPSFHPA